MNSQLSTLNSQPAAASHPACRMFPSAVASGLVILPEPRELTTRRHIMSARARWAAHRASKGQFSATPETARFKELVREWVDTEPHPFGALKRYCHDQGLQYSTFANGIAKLRLERKAAAALERQRLPQSPA